MTCGSNVFGFLQLAAVLLLPLLADDARADELAGAITSEELVVGLAGTKMILVDIRLSGETPVLPAIPNVVPAHVPWPNQAYDSSSNDMHVRFYRAIRRLQRQNTGVPIVLVCGVGARSRQALALAGGFGLGRGLSHVEGGLHGNDRDPGLLLVLGMR